MGGVFVVVFCDKQCLVLQGQKSFSISSHNVPAGGVPCTPVRQKMNAMCRSLKMLNVARLNVKAQKLHPDASPEAAGERGVPKTAGGRAAAKLENRGRTRGSRLRGTAHCRSARCPGPCTLFRTLLCLEVSVPSLGPQTFIERLFPAHTCVGNTGIR